MQLEFHQLDRRWEHLRVRHPARQRRLLASLAESGQQTPIVVVAAEGQADRYVVIDGYKRIVVLEQLGRDSDHPNSWKRLKTSATSLKLHFGKRPLSSITAGDLEDFKSLRRVVHKVREVTIRHDLHALSLLFQYGIKHRWCQRNVVDEVEIPSDAEAIRMLVLTLAEEAFYFATIEKMRAHRLAKNRPARGLDDLRDLGVLMLNQGCRPEELREMEQGAVDLERGFFTITKGKSAAARRTLRLTAASRAVLATRLQSPGRWVFPSHRKPAAHIGNVQRMHDAVLKESKLQFVPYDLRHTAATRWAESGVDIATIAAWLGHANLRSVQKYIHPSKEHLNAAAAKFEQEWIEKSCPNFDQNELSKSGKTSVN